MELTKRTYTVKEASLILGISKDAIYDAVKRGDLKAVRVGRRVAISADPLNQLLQSEQDLVNGLQVATNG
jgi:excisionase family DNA binding protein